MGDKQQKVLAVASGGGHWVQLMRLRPALEGREVVYVTVRKDMRAAVAPQRFHTVMDSNAKQPHRLVFTAAKMFWILLRERPDVVLSTGAAPGLFALMFGKLVRARTVWIDSIANAEKLSMAGRHAGRFADLWLTQWSELAQEGGPEFAGRVL